MNKPSYVCSKCSRAFRRRWNAERHNDTIHKGLSSINIKYKSGRVNSLKNRSGFNPSYVTTSISKEFEYLHQKMQMTLIDRLTMVIHL